MSSPTKKNTSTVSRKRPCRPKKKHFQGNQTVTRDGKKIQGNPGPSNASKRKLSSGSDTIAHANADIACEILNFPTVFNELSEYVRCKDCGEEITFTAEQHSGLGFKIRLQCAKCEPRFIDSSPKLSLQSYEVNTRFVFAMRMLGVGYSGLVRFCGLMDLPSFFCRPAYNRIVKSVQFAASAVAELSMRRAVEQEVEITGDNNSIIISGDGSWRKRGFQSLQGVVAVIGNHTGKVLDVVIKSSFCTECKIWEARSGTLEYLEWLEEHQDGCLQNHEGSAGQMEVKATCDIFRRSVEKHNIKYICYIGDGDSKTFSAVKEDQPYGPEFEISKGECVGHVQKRMGTRLRNVKKSGKGLGGRGKLTHGLITELTLYYGKAIRSNSTVEDMKNAIWATFHHKCSTDDRPQHDHCPSGPDSWCTWQKAKATGTLDEYRHKPPLHKDVQQAILPVYEALSADELLARCVGHFTQNSNESLHSLIWKLAPKESFSGIEIVEIATYTAVATFNDGFVRELDIMSGLSLSIGFRAFQMAKAEDDIRLKDAEKRTQRSTKIARIEKNRRSAAAAEAEENLATSFYSAGSF